MTRSTLYWLPCLGLVLASFSACGGVNAGDLFSSSGGSGPSAGSPSNAGEPGEGGAGPAGGSSAGGRSEAGESSGGSSPEAGASTGGASMAGGTSEGGASVGGASAGASMGGAGTGGDPGIAGMGGGSSEPNCQELFERAAKELTAAQACNIAVDAKQCTGKVETTCGCQVFVQRGDSAETKAYEDTLKQIEKKKCVQQCPAIVCAPANFAQCKVAQGGGIMGTCTSYGFQQD